MGMAGPAALVAVCVYGPSLFATQPLAHALGALAVGTVPYQAIYAGAAAVTLAVGTLLMRRERTVRFPAPNESARSA